MYEPTYIKEDDPRRHLVQPEKGHTYEPKYVKVDDPRRHLVDNGISRGKRK